ncbi:MAG: hypothetical protein AB1564_10685 [Chloroflexota bacterium]
MNQKAIVRKYISSIRPLVQAELDWFKSQPSLSKAVKNAGLAINSEGKRYSHQRRIKRGLLPRVEKILSKNIKAIERCSSFDELFDLIDVLLMPVDGIEELYVYDTSLRIGAKLNLFPTKVYLHAGTRDGAKALGLNGKQKTVKPSDLPNDYHILKPHEIEDVLCIFKDELKQMQHGLTDKELKRRSWCG